MSNFLKLSIELCDETYVSCLVADREIDLVSIAWEKEHIDLNPLEH